MGRNRFGENVVTGDFPGQVRLDEVECVSVLSFPTRLTCRAACHTHNLEALPLLLGMEHPPPAPTSFFQPAKIM